MTCRRSYRRSYSSCSATCNETIFCTHPGSSVILWIFGLLLTFALVPYRRSLCSTFVTECCSTPLCLLEARRPESVNTYKEHSNCCNAPHPSPEQQNVANAIISDTGSGADGGSPNSAVRRGNPRAETHKYVYFRFGEEEWLSRRVGKTNLPTPFFFKTKFTSSLAYKWAPTQFIWKSYKKKLLELLGFRYLSLRPSRLW